VERGVGEWRGARTKTECPFPDCRHGERPQCGAAGGHRSCGEYSSSAPVTVRLLAGVEGMLPRRALRRAEHVALLSHDLHPSEAVPAKPEPTRAGPAEARTHVPLRAFPRDVVAFASDLS